MNSNPAHQDQQDSKALFKVLEERALPLYYKRNSQDLSPKWLFRVKQAMYTLGWKFSSDRMVKDYVIKAYLPAAGITTCDMDAPFV